MKFRFVGLLFAQRIPTAAAFAPRGPTVRAPSRYAPSPRPSSDGITFPTARRSGTGDNDFDDDWHADYDESKFERADDDSEDYGYGGARTRGGGGGGRRGRRGGGRAGGRRALKKPKAYLGPNGHDYRISEGSGPNVSKFSEEDVHALLAERLQAKFARDFNVADSIQAELIDGGVFVHEGLKEWRADGVPYESFRDGGGRGGGHAGNRPYSKSPYSGDVEGASDSLIDRLIEERTKFKNAREFGKADLVREGLRTRFNVLVDDRLRQWSAGGDFGEEHNARREIADKFANRGYAKSSSSLPSEEEEQEYIQHHVEARAAAKRDRNFKAADRIRLDLAQRFDVTIDDKQKLWSIGGIFEESGARMGKPRGVYTRRGGGELSSEEEDAISRMISDRHRAKKRKDFAVADEIRDMLLHTYNVKIDDRSAEWRVDTDEYAMAGENALSEEEVDYIGLKLRERFSLKCERLYEDADEIRDDLRGRYGVKIDDRTKEWLVDSGPLLDLTQQ